jgi:pilus assembly protein Flp/PilA
MDFCWKKPAALVQRETGPEAPMENLVVRYVADESGATAIEYGLVASLIAVAIIGVLGTLGINLRDKANEIAEAVGDAGRR